MSNISVLKSGAEFNAPDNNDMRVHIHGPIHPEDVRVGEMVTARIKSRDPEFSFNREMRVWKLSPLGIELFVENPEERLPKGLPIDLDVTIGKQVVAFRGLVVDYVAEKINRNYIGIRLTQDAVPRVGIVERRAKSRWSCSPQYYPTCIAPNPAKYNDFVYFSIKDISGAGAQLLTSFRNKFILPGMVFDAMVSFPMIGQANITFMVKNVRVSTENGVEQLALGVEMLGLDNFTKSKISQYVLQFSSVASVAEIDKADLPTPELSKAVNFSYVKTEEEYRQVLALRHKAYLSANKIAPTVTPGDMADIFDSRSRIVIGKYNGRVVASCRLSFSNYDEKMEQEQYVQWPQDLPRRDEIVEMMRLCTDPDFRGGDIILAMFQFMAVTVVQSKRRWVVLCASDEMVKFYDKLGFVRTNLKYEHPKLNNMVHHVLYGDVIRGLTGAGVDPIVWNLVWRDSAIYMKDYRILVPDPMGNIRMGFYRMFAPIAQIYAKLNKKPKRKK